MGNEIVRIGDSERDRVAIALREHCVAGRLTLDELSTRLDELNAARSDAELAAVLRELPDAPHAPQASKSRAWLITLIGSEQRRGRWRVPRRMFAFSLLGAPDLDFRNAVVTSEEVRITSFSLIGSLTALVPPGVEVDLGGFCLIGGNDFVMKDSDAAEAAPAGPRLRIRCFSLLGGAGVMHVPADESVSPRALRRAGRQ